MANGHAFRLDKQDAAFLRIDHLSILGASRGPDNIPFVIRALGYRFTSDLGQATLFFPKTDARELLAHIADNGKLAAVFSLPSTHQSVQLKGSDARVGRVVKADLELVNSYCRAFVDHLEKLGFARKAIEAMLAFEPDDLCAVTFTPSSAFSQTPGPNAGRAIGVTR
jgi:hypothetical protein